MKKWYLVVVVVAFFLSILSLGWAAPVIKEIYYQKKTTLTYPKVYTFRFSLYDAESGGGVIWSEEKPMNMTNATIKTYLGEITPFDLVDFSQQYWVQVDRW